MKRWTTQWENSKTRELPAIDEVARRLALRMPRQQRRGRSPTATTASATASPTSSTGRIAAVLDWELCTLGDPLADVGYLGVYWFDGNAANIRRQRPDRRPGFPAYTDLLERYATRTGRDLTGDRLLRRVQLLAPGRHQRGRLRPLPARRDGRAGLSVDS